MPSTTVEDYLKQLFLEQQKTQAKLLPMGSLASAMGVTPGTATSMVKTLADAKLVTYEPREGVKLTKSGEKLALRVLRRHRLVESFLVNILGLDWAAVHDEAENLEHVISDVVLEKIDALLGHPTVDPHGDPIPTETGKLSIPASRSLAECEEGSSHCIVRILDQNPEFLRFVEKQKLMPGSTITVQQRMSESDTITVRRANREETSLGLSAAAKIQVEARRKSR